jgi:hypothetical protein
MLEVLIMNKKILIGSSLLLLLLVVGIAFANDFGNQPQRQLVDSEIHEQIESAMLNGDYQTWKQIHEDNNLPIRNIELTEENFAKMTQMHNAMESGDFQTANAIREELGFKNQGLRQGQRNGLGQHRTQKGQGLRQGQKMGPRNGSCLNE